MESGAYSALKVAHHHDRLAELRAGRQPVPVQVQIVLSDGCNMACGFCAFRMPGYSSNQRFGVVDADTGDVNNNPHRQIPRAKVPEQLIDFAVRVQ